MITQTRSMSRALLVAMLFASSGVWATLDAHAAASRGEAEANAPLQLAMSHEDKEMMDDDKKAMKGDDKMMEGAEKAMHDDKEMMDDDKKMMDGKDTMEEGKKMMENKR
jgi:hypothetical protein